MDPVEIIEESAKLSAYTIGGMMMYPVLLSGLNLLGTTKFKESIKSQEQLNKIVYEESKKLGIHKRSIQVIFTDEDEAILHARDGKNIIEIGGIYATRECVKHELYHVLKDSHKEFDSEILFSLYYLTIAEPRAMLYGLWDIKL